MGLFDGIEDVRVRKGPPCSVTVVRGKLSPEDATQFDLVLTSPVASTTFARTLRANGIDIGAYPLNRHRKGDCLCGRS